MSHNAGAASRIYARYGVPLRLEGAKELVVAGVCAAYGISERELWEKNRRALEVAARRTAYAWLVMCGYQLMEIARLAGRDHATVIHALDRNSRYEPDLFDDLTYPAEIPRLVATIVLAAVTPAARGGVWLYLEGLVSGKETRLEAYKGLVYLAGHPAARDVALHYLKFCGQGAQAWRIELHARQLGIRWVSAIGEGVKG